jgi:hypothetical protein
MPLVEHREHLTLDSIPTSGLAAWCQVSLIRRRRMLDPWGMSRTHAKDAGIDLNRDDPRQHTDQNPWRRILPVLVEDYVDYEGSPATTVFSRTMSIMRSLDQRVPTAVDSQGDEDTGLVAFILRRRISSTRESREAAITAFPAHRHHQNSIRSGSSDVVKSNGPDSGASSPMCPSPVTGVTGVTASWRDEEAELLHDTGGGR